MPLQIMSEPPPEPGELAETMRRKIEAALPGALVRVQALSPGHFEVEVEAEQFQDLSLLKQQQRVYAAIAPMLSGNSALVHAIDRMVTRVRPGTP